MKTALAAVGFTSTIGQIVLMRELVATFYGNELLFGLVLMAWLAWVAAGSWGLVRLAGHRQLGKGAFAAGLVLAGISLPAEITLTRSARSLLGVTPGAFVEFGPMVGVVIVILAPLCLITGFLFTLGTRLTVEQGRAAGQAYVWEAIGAVIGGALFSFILIHLFDPYQAALLVTSASLIIAVNLWLHPKFLGDASRIMFYALLIPLLIGAFFLGPYLHQTTLRWQWPDLAFAADSPYGRLLIQAREGQRVFYQNGLLAFETQGTFPEEVAHFPLLAHPEPRRILLIGGGVAGNLREILKHPVDRVTYVELDPLLIKAARIHLPPQDAAVLADSRVRLALTDGRLYVKQQAGQQSFDVIILNLPAPSTGALNRFYTREFFTEVRAILNPDGIFALGLPSAENYWSQELARRNDSVYHTLRAVFPQIVVLPGEHNFFLTSDAPLAADPSLLVERLAERNVENRWVTPNYITYIFTTDRFGEVQRQLEATASAQLNRDLAPICYYYDLALWLSRFYPNLRPVFEGVSLINLGWITVPIVLMVGLARWRRNWAAPLVIAGIGLAQMMLEVIILFAFQLLHGYIYAEISLIVTTFMAGLALGGAASNRLIDNPGQRRRDTETQKKKVKPRKILITVQTTIILYSGLLPFILLLPIPAPTLVFPLLALLAGFLTGMAFPVALALGQGNVSQRAGMLYGADLVGGCLGALLGAVFFIPLLGIPQTCAAVALVGLAGLLALI